MNGNESGFLFVFVDGWLSCFVAVCCCNKLQSKAWTLNLPGDHSQQYLPKFVVNHRGARIVLGTFPIP